MTRTSLTDEQILAQVDASALLVIKIVAVLFMAFFVVLSFVFSVMITLLVFGWLITRRTLLFILTRKEVRQAFAIVGGR
jgi:hypothetical protein